MGPHGAQLAELAKNAFLQSTHLSLLVLSIIVCAAAVFVAIWSPGRDARQWRLIRRLTKDPSGSDDELRGAVADHDDGRVGSPAGEGGKHRAVDHHSASTPRTLHRVSTTAVSSSSAPIRAVAARCCDVDHDTVAALAVGPANSRASSVPARSVAASAAALS